MRNDGGEIRERRAQEGAVIPVALFCAAAFFLMLFLAKSGQAAVLDDPVRQFFYDMRQEWLTPIVKGITYLGNWQTVTALCIVLLLLQPTRITYGIPVSIGAIFVSLLNKWIKSLVQRPRPDEMLHLISQGGFSFPSGHSITSMFVYGMLIYLIRTNVKNKRTANILTVLLAIPMICIGLSRIYLGVHYPTDVLAGWSLGVLTILGMAAVLKRVARRKDAAASTPLW